MLGNGLSCLLFKHEWRCLLISLCTYSLVIGSIPAHKSYAITIANNPQLLPSSWQRTFTTLVVQVSLSVRRMVYTCVSIVPSSTRTVCIESNKSTCLETRICLIDKPSGLKIYVISEQIYQEWTTICHSLSIYMYPVGHSE